MNIRLAHNEDLPHLLEIFEIARAYQKSHGNPTQWPGYPSEQKVKQDISQGCCYVLEEDGSVIGTFAMIPGEEPTYQIIEDGNWINQTPYCTIHRVASDGTHQGVGQVMMTWCAQKCRHIRIDTHRNNVVMQHVIEKSGFIYCGTIYAEDGTPRMAYELVS